MKTELLAQASNYEPEIVGQRAIISEEDMAARNENPELSSFVSFVYVILAIALLIAAGWAVQKLFTQDSPKPKAGRKPTPKAPVGPRKITKP